MINQGSTAAALGYLVLTSARNRFVWQVRRLRSTRYALALAAGAFYFWFIFFRPDRDAPLSGVVGGEWSALVGSLLLAGLVANWWLFGGDRMALAFSPAEVHFLFPAPVTRRALIHFKLLRAQSVILVNTLLWVGLLGQGRTPLNSGLRALALWVLFSTLHLHRLGASLTRASAAEHGASGARRGALPVSVFTAAFLALAWSLVSATPVLRSAWALGLLPFLESVGQTLREPVPNAVLLPFRTLLAPGLAVTAAEWARAIGPALALMLAHYVWVMRVDASFEEAAVEASERRAARLAALRGEKAAVPRARRAARPSRLPLAPTGRPEVAIIWKNFVAVSRAVRVPLIVGPMLAGAVALAVVSAARPGGTTLTHFAGVLLTSWGALLVAAGPLWIRYDLRQDLPKIELLRAFPLSGSAIVGAEIAASTVILSAFQLALFTLAWLAFLRDPSLELAPRARTALLCAALLVLPAVNALALAIQNAAALFFPGWVRLGANRGGGVEAMGLGLITMLASALVLAVLLVVPMLLGAGAGYALRGWLGLWAVAPALAAAVLGVGGELLLLVRWLGRVFERTDPSMVAAQE